MAASDLVAAAECCKVSQTAKFTVLDHRSVNVQHFDPSAVEEPTSSKTTAGKGRDKTRLTKESGPKVSGAAAEAGELIGGEFSVGKGSYLEQRLALYDTIKERRAAEDGTLPHEPITITLPDGKSLPGVSYETTPHAIAMSISKGLADSCVVAKINYSRKVQLAQDMQICENDGMEDHHEDMEEVTGGELWDLHRPLEGDCEMSLIKFDDKDAKMVFWHSSAHILGQALEHIYGSYLTIGPPVTNGFYYDSYMGKVAVSEADYKKIDAEVSKIVKAKQPFERMVVTKEEALELFEYNPFKYQLISTKVPDGSRTTVYRNGDLIDLCRGPHLPNTSKVKAFAVLRNSSTNWLGNTNNDSLQRIYAVSYPDKKMLKAYLQNLEEAKKRDHRVIGPAQKLFFFHELSPGSAFWLPHGARIYNTLIDFIKQQYWARGYTEVLTPNIYNSKLWETSGHWQHYAENMFQFESEGQTFALKPMNCPGHCLMFDHTNRSWRDLPMRYADFGVLHRNELSGALTGLTRVRRFQQDDAHIFCAKEQIKEEVLGALNFMKYVYDIFGMSYKLELSTRPKKALGDVELWNEAEAALAAAMNEFSGEGSWRENPGDGAFYGPKIDIKVMDAMERVHQCATVQLDFQLPIRFNLRYKTKAETFERPVIIHRAMLGSVERMTAVLIEHFAGKWPFWLSPRQVMIVPVTDKVAEFAESVKQRIHDAGFFVEADMSGNTMQKKVRNAQLEQYNYILVLGEKEQADGTVNVRLRNNEVKGVIGIDDFLAMLKEDKATFK